VTALEAGPADVLAVGGYGGSWGQKLIRIGAVLRGQPGVANHVVVLTHQDQEGRWIGIEGKPGGVGPCDCTRYLAESTTRSNHGQPRPGGQKAMIGFLASCAASLGIRYDWAGIAEDAARACGAEDLSGVIDRLWRWPDPKAKGNPLPGQVVCSSLAAMLYSRAGWAEPSGKDPDRTVSPADWWAWADKEMWGDAGHG